MAFGFIDLNPQLTAALRMPTSQGANRLASIPGQGGGIPMPSLGSFGTSNLAGAGSRNRIQVPRLSATPSPSTGPVTLPGGRVIGPNQPMLYPGGLTAADAARQANATPGPAAPPPGVPGGGAAALAGSGITPENYMDSDLHKSVVARFLLTHPSVIGQGKYAGASLNVDPSYFPNDPYAYLYTNPATGNPSGAETPVAANLDVSPEGIYTTMSGNRIDVSKLSFEEALHSYSRDVFDAWKKYHGQG